MLQLPKLQVDLLTRLSKSNEPTPIDRLAGELDVATPHVYGALVALSELGLCTLDERRSLDVRLGKRGCDYQRTGLPEKTIIRSMKTFPDPSIKIPEIAIAARLTEKQVGETLKILLQKGWIQKDGKQLKLTSAGRQAADRVDRDEQLFDQLREGSLTDRVADEAIRLFEQRPGFLDTRERTEHRASISPTGVDRLQQGLKAVHETNQLTHEMLRNGTWREATFRAYDVALAAKPLFPGKPHPFRRILQETRRAFLELGFDEVESPLVESSFWNFDALFQPQDHPARDMQDTFYVGRPASVAIADDHLLSAVRAAHETGGDTGSVGWRYPWRRDVAERPVLRTHTTAATIRALAQNPVAPRKIFCVGPVFRRETIDYKHLPVFHQVDGIIVDPQASLSSLLGTLDAFYRKMGFKKFQFRPSYFPYTEPSIEIFVFLEEKKEWVEMGGAGIFRPEVTQPLGCRDPVLAWGLGMERLAMFRYGLTDIREIYLSRLDWLRGAPLCR